MSLQGDPNDLPGGWITENTVAVTVESNTNVFMHDLVFDIHSYSTLVPKTLYDILTAPLKQSVQQAFANSTSLLPLDVVGVIAGFADEPILAFDCDDAAKLKSLTIGDWKINSEMLYIRISREKCLLNIMPHSQQHDDDETIDIGLGLIKQFHLAVYFGDDGDYAVVSERKDKVRRPVLGKSGSTADLGRGAGQYGPDDDPRTTDGRSRSSSW